MRLDKLTTKFQQALADAQSLAIGHDNQMIEPQHLLLALLQQDDGGTASLLEMCIRDRNKRAAGMARTCAFLRAPDRTAYTEGGGRFSGF